jgi:integrase
MVCLVSRRIINNGASKVKLGLREQKSLESVANHNFDDNKQVYHEELSQRIYNVTDALKSKYTKRDYGYAFSQFLRDGAKTQDLQVLLDHKPRVIEQMLIGYIELLRDKGRAHKTIALHAAAILHFFTLNDVPLNKEKITRFIPPDESPTHSHLDKPYTLQDIRRILESCDDRTSVIVTLLASTGMRIGAIPELMVGDLTLIPDHSLYKVHVYASSKRAQYFTFCTPECRATIDRYLDFRRRQGEKIKDNTPLIRELFNVHKPYFIEAPRPASPDIIRRALEKALHTAGVNQRVNGLIKGKRREIMRSHGFRKFVITTMVEAGVKAEYRRYLTGHAQVGQDASYVLLSEDKLLAEYIKATPMLTIHSESRLEEQIQELQSDRLHNIEEVHHKWLTELKQEYTLILKTEWEMMKDEMKAIREHILPEYYEHTGKPVHLDANYSDNE